MLRPILTPPQHSRLPLIPLLFLNPSEMTTELSTAHKYHLLLALCTTALFCAALSFTLSVGAATPLGATLALLTAAGGLAFTVNTVFWIMLCSGGHSPFYSGGLDASEVKTVRSDADVDHARL